MSREDLWCDCKGWRMCKVRPKARCFWTTDIVKLKRSKRIMTFRQKWNGASCQLLPGLWVSEMVRFPGKSFVWSLAWLDLYHLEVLKCRVFKTNSKTSNKTISKTVQKWSLSVDQTDGPIPTGVCSSARWGSVLTTLMEVSSDKSAKIKRTPRNTVALFGKF